MGGISEKRVYLSPPHLGGEEIEYVKEAFAANWVAPLGPHVEAFERECALHSGRTGALALSSGTAAAALSAILAGIKPGDLCFCPSLTFVASLAPFVQSGAVPVLIDSEPESWNISPKALEEALSDAEKNGRKPGAVIAVNLYGQPCDMDRILPLCERYGVPVIEDAAESLGSCYRGRPSGSFGKFSFYSFNGNKIITTSGGGMLLSDDAEAIERARFLSAQARDPAPWYQHSELGYNFRMSNILAGIGRAQLKLLPLRVKERRAVFRRYYEAFSETPGVSFMPEPGWSQSNRWLTAIIVDPEKTGVGSIEIMKALEAVNVESRPVWKPMHLQPAFGGAKYYGHEGRDVSGELFAKGLCLPSGSNMTDDDISFVIGAVRDVLP
ncbi:MAG: aminotransferase class I/II-fold pyridoxal phosphate-dependent enzyme [Synergistaceae bacterium]|jgi:pyridoxal phosphate-dependent aminotransferase EpsN|nr:aminotransferase class I/II-fold pyridoxal phosphate-dependent enzyme [Synergistaceae bacterium]